MIVVDLQRETGVAAVESEAVNPLVVDDTFDHKPFRFHAYIATILMLAKHMKSSTRPSEEQQV